jgi:hypothetical protein
MTSPSIRPEKIEELIARLRATHPHSGRNPWPPIQEAIGLLASLNEALTPSGDTKAAYIGEFKFGIIR